LVRLVRTDSPALWLGGRKRGLAVVPPAPAEVLESRLGVPTPVLDTTGPITVTALDQPLPLEALPPGVAAPAIRAAPAFYARADACDAWTLRQQSSALNRATCLHDDLPTVGSVDLASLIPFLSLSS